MTIERYIERVTKRHMSYYDILVNVASRFGEVIEESFEHYKSDEDGEYYTIGVTTSSGAKRVAIGTYWDDCELDGIETIDVCETYKGRGYYCSPSHICDREGNIYKYNKDTHKFEKVER